MNRNRLLVGLLITLLALPLVPAVFADDHPAPQTSAPAANLAVPPASPQTWTVAPWTQKDQENWTTGPWNQKTWTLQPGEQNSWTLKQRKDGDVASLSHDGEICYRIRAYIFRRDDGHAPEMVGSTTCGPRQPQAKDIRSPKPRLIPAD